MKILSVLLTVVLMVTLLVTSSNGKCLKKKKHNRVLSPVCGFESCPVPKRGMINVHLVPHTHLELGDEKTFEEYYQGDATAMNGVKHILDNVVNKLHINRTYRFVLVETAYLWRWWGDQIDSTRRIFKRLVNNGQLEIAGGGWSMNDEAVTSYQAIIDQLTWGIKRLGDMFGKCAKPNVGWQIDTIGHSRVQSSIFADMGYDGLFLGRLDHQDKESRRNNTELELIWEGAPHDSGVRTSLFTHILLNAFDPPPAMCFENCHTQQVFANNSAVSEDVIERKVRMFLELLSHQQTAYKTDNLIYTMGGLFHFETDSTWFESIDLLIKYVNMGQFLNEEDEREEGDKHKNRKMVNVFYSTPSCYLKAIHNTKTSWPTKDDDFILHSSSNLNYWSGFFTSRPTIKYFERLGNNFMQVIKQLYAMTNIGPTVWPDLDRLREAMGVMQHHVAVTGMSLDNPTKDYSRMLYDAILLTDRGAEKAVKKLFTSKDGPKTVEKPFKLESCLQLNISSCPPSEVAGDFVITVYNPLGHVRNEYIRVPVVGRSYTVRDSRGDFLPNQMVPVAHSVLLLAGHNKPVTHDLLFRAKDLPPLGFRMYYVSLLDMAYPDDQTFTRDSTNKTSLRGDQAGVDLYPDGSIKSIWGGGIDVPVNHTMGYYTTSATNPSNSKVFAPSPADLVPVKMQSFTVFSGPLVDEVHQVYELGWINQVIRVYKEENYVEFAWLVGPIPTTNGSGVNISREVISRYVTNIDSQDSFFTDSNGREMMSRGRDERETYQLENSEQQISSNYYPITGRIVLKNEDGTEEMAVLTDRSQGGSSLATGEVELMIHRRVFINHTLPGVKTVQDYQYGDLEVARGTHYVIVGTPEGYKPSFEVMQRNIVLHKFMKPWLFISRSPQCYNDWVADYNLGFSGLTKPLPPNVNLLTLEPWEESTVLLRLEHFVDVKDDEQLSQPAIIDVQNLFTLFNVVAATEMTLGGNHDLRDHPRLQWIKMASEEVEDIDDEDGSDLGAKLVEEPETVPKIIPKLIPKNNPASPVNPGKPGKPGKPGNPAKPVLTKKLNLKKIVLKSMQIRTFVLEITDKKSKKSVNRNDES